MTDLTAPPIDLRAQLASLAARVTDLEKRPHLGQIFKLGEGEMIGSDRRAAFPLPQGQRPYMVLLDRAPQIRSDGGTEDFRVDFDGFIYTVVFQVAPAVGAIVTCIPERV